jgi:WD40 repeat protein
MFAPLLLVAILSAEPRVLETPLPRHTEKAISVAYSPDGQRLATGGWDRMIRIWDAASGRLLATWEAHTPAVWPLVFSNDGLRLLSGGRDGKVALWDIATSEELLRFEGHTAGVYKLAWLQGEGRLLTGSFDHTVREWDVATGRELRKIELSTEVHGLAVAPDARTFAVATNQGRIAIYKRDFTEGLAWQGHGTGVDHLSYSPDGKVLVSGGWDGKAILWNPEDGAKLRTLDHKVNVWPVVFSADGKLLVTGSLDGGIRFWNPATGELRRELEGHPKGVPMVAFRPDGKVLASVGHEGTVRQWDVATGLPVGPAVGNSERLYDLQFSPDGRALRALGQDRSLVTWNVAAGRIVRRVVVEPRNLRGGYLGEKWSLVGSDTSAVELIDTATGKALPLPEAGRANPTHLALSADGRYLAFVNQQNQLALWDREGKEIVRIRTESPQPVVFTPDGENLVFAPRNGVLQVLQTRDGTLRQTFVEEARQLRHLRVSPDGRLLAGVVDGEVIVWEIASGHIRWRIDLPPPDTKPDIRSGVNGEAHPVAFSPDGRVLYLTDFAGGLHGYDTLQGKKLLQRPGTRSQATCLAVAPDSRLVAIGDVHGTIRLWDVDTPPLAFRSHPPEVLRKWLADLGHAGGETPRHALVGLVEGGVDTVPLLSQALKPVPKLEPGRVAALIRQLDAEDFDEREAAQLALLRFGVRIEGEIDAVLKVTTASEARRRLREIKQELASATLDTQTLRELRAIEVLERLGAKDVLAPLAAGDPEAVTTKQAKAALVRLGR